MDVRGIVRGYMDWILLAQDRLAGSCEHGNEPSGSIKGGTFFDLLRNSSPWS
jgi:hypothetical protein